jgi:hypothetical protein
VKRPAGRLAEHPAMDRLAARLADMTDAQRAWLGAYLEKGLPVSEQLRLAIDAGAYSRYALAKLTGIGESTLSRFMAGKTGLSIESIDALCAVLGLALRPVRRARKGG